MKIHQFLFLNFTLVLLLLPGKYPTSNIAYPHFKYADKAETERLKSFAVKANDYCQQHKMNEEFCFIVDMNLPAGKYRFFVYDLKKDQVINNGIAAHGCCNNSFLKKPAFSNTSGSGCSSLGKYKVGSSYEGRFGKAYKLFGLDSSNDNAFRRNIVLHSYYLVPDNEVYPGGVCNSLGCVMVSDDFLKKLAARLESSTKPVLLWVIN